MKLEKLNNLRTECKESALCTSLKTVKNVSLDVFLIRNIIIPDFFDNVALKIKTCSYLPLLSPKVSPSHKLHVDMLESLPVKLNLKND